MELLYVHLEYLLQAWWPWLKTDAKRHSTKLVKELQDIEYVESVQVHNIHLLSCRMEKGDMILVYKILHGFLEDI